MPDGRNHVGFPGGSTRLLSAGLHGHSTSDMHVQGSRVDEQWLWTMEHMWYGKNRAQSAALNLADARHASYHSVLQGH